MCERISRQNLPRGDDGDVLGTATWMGIKQLGQKTNTGEGGTETDVAVLAGDDGKRRECWDDGEAIEKKAETDMRKLKLEYQDGREEIERSRPIRSMTEVSEDDQNGH